jgi:hypothetical protein
MPSETQRSDLPLRTLRLACRRQEPSIERVRSHRTRGARSRPAVLFGRPVVLSGAALAGIRTPALNCTHAGCHRGLSHQTPPHEHPEEQRLRRASSHLIRLTETLSQHGEIRWAALRGTLACLNSRPCRHLEHFWLSYTLNCGTWGYELRIFSEQHTAACLAWRSHCLYASSESSIACYRDIAVDPVLTCRISLSGPTGS